MVKSKNLESGLLGLELVALSPLRDLKHVISPLRSLVPSSINWGMECLPY